MERETNLKKKPQKKLKNCHENTLRRNKNKKKKQKCCWLDG